MADGVRLADKPVIGNPTWFVGLDNLGNTRLVTTDQVTALVQSDIGGPNYETRALLFADLAWAADTLGTVWGDATVGFRGIYKKAGASGAGSWALIGPLPASDTSALQAEVDAIEADIADLVSRDIGATSATSILDRAAGDTRYVNVGEASSITVPMLANMADGTYLGRQVGAGTGGVQAISAANLKSNLALNNVNNTSDLNKPISTATQAALDNKQPAHAFLDALSGIGPLSNGVLVKVGEANLETDPLGVATADSILRRSDGDARFAPLSLGTDVGGLESLSGSVVRSTSDRPGDAPALFMPVRAGDGVAPAEFPEDWSVDSSTRGRVLRVKGTEATDFYGVGAQQLVAPRRAYSAFAGHAFRVVWRVARNVTPSDPSGDAVEIGVVFLGSTKATLGGGGNPWVFETDALTIESGVQQYEATLSTDSGLSPDKVFPSGTVYFRPYVRLYGVEHETDVISISVADETWFGTGGGGSGNFDTQLALIADASVLKKAGGAMVGAVADVDYLGTSHITRLAAAIFWTTAASGVPAGFEIRTLTSPRWQFVKVDAESGSDAGSDLSVRRVLDAGTVIEEALWDRGTGALNFSTRPSVDGFNVIHEDDFATAAQLRAGLAGRVVTADADISAQDFVALTYAASFTPDLETFVNGSMSLGAGQDIVVNNPVEAIRRNWSIVFTVSDTGAHTIRFGGSSYRYTQIEAERTANWGAAGRMTRCRCDILPGNLYAVTFEEILT